MVKPAEGMWLWLWAKQNKMAVKLIWLLSRILLTSAEDSDTGRLSRGGGHLSADSLLQRSRQLGKNKKCEAHLAAQPHTWWGAPAVVACDVLDHTSLVLLVLWPLFSLCWCLTSTSLMPACIFTLAVICMYALLSPEQQVAYFALERTLTSSSCCCDRHILISWKFLKTWVWGEKW